MSPTKEEPVKNVIATINTGLVKWFMVVATTGIISSITLLFNINNKLVELIEHDKAHSAFEVQQDKINDFLQTAAASHTVRISILETNVDNLKNP
jgi:hypothetical protein